MPGCAASIACRWSPLVRLGVVNDGGEACMRRTSLPTWNGACIVSVIVSVRTNIEALGTIAILRLQRTQQLRAIADALGAGGVTALEVTMTMPAALEALATL